MSFTIASIFLSIYNIAQTSIMQCFLTDVEIAKAENRTHTHGGNRPAELQELIEEYESKGGDNDGKGSNKIN